MSGSGSELLDDVGEVAVGHLDPELRLTRHDRFTREPLVVRDGPGQGLDLCSRRAGDVHGARASRCASS